MKVPVGSVVRNPGAASYFAKSEGSWSYFGDEAYGRFEQSFAQIAVMVASASESTVPGPAHVKEFYIGCACDPA